MVEHMQMVPAMNCTILPSCFTSCARRSTRFNSVPTSQRVLSGAAFTVCRMVSVLPMWSDCLQTSKLHSGCEMTRPSGCWFLNLMMSLGWNIWCTEQ